MQIITYISVAKKVKAKYLMEFPEILEGIIIADILHKHLLFSLPFHPRYHKCMWVQEPSGVFEEENHKVTTGKQI